MKKQPAKPGIAAAGRGRKTKLTAAKCKTAESLATTGAIDTEIAAALQICERSLYKYKAQNPEFMQALKRGKKIADDKAEAALYSRVLGYEYIETHIDLTRDEAGKIVLKNLNLVKKQLAPDVLACQTWLNNRRPEQWRQKIPELSNLADSVSSVLQIMRRHEEKKPGSKS